MPILAGLGYIDRMNLRRIFRCPSAFMLPAAMVGVFVVAPFASAVAQQCKSMGATHNMADMQPVPPPEQLPVPEKMTGIGNSHISIKASPEVQAWFDQGLSLMHDFWDYESTKAFEQAVRVDPNCAMCWWGLAQAEGFRNSDAAVYGKKALAKAVELKGHAGAEAKLYIEAAQAGSEAKEDDNNTSEVAILRKLVKKNPKDTQARIFLAEAVGDGYDDKGEPKAGQKERIAILEGVIKDAPNDSAANHYWIHAMEPGNHPEAALKSAALLASLAPTSGHMVHMPGHIFYRVGNYADAEHWFAESTETDERYLRDWHESADNDWNYVHNMMYAIANLMEQGKLSEANALSDHLSAARGKLSATLYIWSARDQVARLSQRLPVALRVGDWDAVLTMLGQSNLDHDARGEGEKTANLRFLSSELSEYARGMKALENPDMAAVDVAGAQAASDRMDAGLFRAQRAQADKDAAEKDKDKNKKDEAKKEEPPMSPIMPDAEAGPLLKCLNVASLELRAGVLAAQGKLDEAKKVYASAAAAEKKLGYHEPPLYIRPVGENEATALIRAKDYAGAKAAYESALAERPNSGFGLYGIARVKELQGDAAGASEGYQAFLKAWPAADASLPEIAHARSVVGGQATGTR
jgi:tetratricopeptide (TPR) repeat protein